MPKNLIFAAFGLLALFNAHAVDCDRDDIEFYLSEGFSPEQITHLCTTADTTGQNTGDYQTVGPVEADSNDPATYLTLAIDSDAVFVDDDKVSFRHTACTERNRIEVCPDMTLEIDLRGLQITDTGRGQGEGSTIEVQGNIQRQINNYSGLSPAKQRVVDRLYKERHAVIPVKEGADVEEAQRALRLLVENANPPLVVSE